MKIEQLNNYFNNSDLTESLNQIYQVYLGACLICKGDLELEENCKNYLIEQLKDCLG